MSLLKVATFNVNSIRSRLDLVMDWLDREKIDVLGLQELKVEEDRFPREVFASRGYTCAVFGQKAYNGVALCSRLPLEEVAVGLGDPVLDEESRVISARAGGIRMINVYAPHGDYRGRERFHHKLNFYRRLLDYLSESSDPRDRVCLMGDLNVAHRDMDVWDPSVLKDNIGTMREEREVFDRLLGFGLFDAYRHLYPDAPGFTWWDYIGGAVWKDQGMRIDYLLLSRPLLELVQEVAVDLWPRRRRKPTPSDHAPVVLTLKDQSVPG